MAETHPVAAISQWQAWKMAARPRTLPAALSPVVVGTGLAVADGAFRPLPALAALAVALLLQIGANLANDYYDYVKGADTPGRLGPPRVAASGLISLPRLRLGIALTFAAAALAGLYLAAVGGWPILLAGLAAILSALAYTGGPYPLGYHGLGDLWVFVFFGLVGVGGTYYVQAGELTLLALLAAVPVGCLTVAILVVNNLRDLDTDRQVGKRTLAVRLGRRGSRVEYVTLLAVAYALPLVLLAARWWWPHGHLLDLPGAGWPPWLPVWLVGAISPSVLLPWLTLPLAIRQVRAIHHLEGRALNQVLAGTASLDLAFSLLFGLGLLLAPRPSSWFLP